MAKLSRKTQKIFASNSAQNQVSTFGSIKAGAVAYSKDVSNIQTEAFEGGWSSAVQDDYAPYRQDRNAVDFVTTSQLAYVFQEGVPEYDANTTYYKGSWVKGLDGDTYAIYESLSDDNIGNDLSDEEKWEAKSFGGGLEIGDIGIAPLGVNEAQNKRRYLNGQVISQAQFVSFTNKLKEAIRLNPSLATSEVNWQATVTNSINGTCGKFVIDDDAGTIRLPKYPDYVSKEYVETAVVGNGMTLGLTDGTIFAGLNGNRYASGGNIGLTASDGYGVQIGTTGAGSAGLSNNTYAGITTDPTKSGVIADFENATTEKIACKWFIQVATGVEESVDVTREIELNNPFSLLDYKWSEYEITNASWLLSDGQFNSGATYISVYNLLLEIYNGTVTKDGVSVKMSTEAYTDTDFVLNTADTTFRLPIKVKLASGNAVVGNGITLGLTNGTNDFSMLTSQIGSSGYGMRPYGEIGVDVGTGDTGSHTITNNVAVGVTTDATKSGIETSSSGLKLYFYVGETIQDANIIAASQVLTTLADCVRKSSATDKKTVVGWSMPDYSTAIALTSSDKTYTATYPCWLLGFANASAGTNHIVYVNGIAISKEAGDYSSIQIPLDIGDIVTCNTADLEGLTVCAMKGVN